MWRLVCPLCPPAAEGRRRNGRHLQRCAPVARDPGRGAHSSARARALALPPRFCARAPLLAGAIRVLLLGRSSCGWHSDPLRRCEALLGRHGGTARHGAARAQLTRSSGAARASLRRNRGAIRPAAARPSRFRFRLRSRPPPRHRPTGDRDVAEPPQTPHRPAQGLCATRHGRWPQACACCAGVACMCCVICVSRLKAFRYGRPRSIVLAQPKLRGRRPSIGRGDVCALASAPTRPHLGS